MAAAPLLRLLGSPHLDDAGGTRHALPNNVPGFLAAWLALRADWADREALCLVFWPDREGREALHNLRANLHRLKAWLHGAGLPDALVAEKRRVRLDLACDAAQLRAACGAARWADALALYGGTLLQGCSLPGMAAVDEWLHAQRGALEAAWREAALHQARQWQAAGRWADAAGLLQQQLAHELLAEDVVQALLRIAPQAGCVEAALALHGRFAQRLAAELGHAPLPATQALAAALRAPQVPQVPSVAVAPHGVAAEGMSRSLAARLAAPALVGRQRERDRLQAACRAGGGMLAVVRGEPGAGKTRLVESTLPDAIWLPCRATARDAPLHPLADYLHDSLQALQERPAFLRHRHLLTRLLPAAAEPREQAAASGAAMQRACMDLLHELGRPLVVDDLQWADADTLHLLRALAGAGRLPLVATLRLGTPAPALAGLLQSLADAQRLQMIDLLPLEAAALAQLVAELSGQAGGAPRFATWLHARCAGNPFFALETVRALFAEGRLTADAQGWHSVLDDLAAGYDELTLPPRVAELVRLRLAALGDATQRVLRVCAVAGHARWLEPIAQAAGLSPMALGDALGEAQTAGVLTERAFAHDLLRESLLEAMPEAQRAATHASWLRHAAALLGPHDTAAHAWAAGDIAQAVAASVAAAQQDALGGLYDAADARLVQALPRVELPAWRARLHAERARVLQQQRRLDAAEAEAALALQELPDPADRALALTVQGEVALHQGRLQAVTALAQAALEAQPGNAEAFMLQVKWDHAQGDFAGAEARLRERLAPLRRERPTAALAITLSSLGSMLDFQGRHAEALPVHREALALARRLGARYTEVEVAINLLWCLPELDMHDEAMAAGEHALALGDCDATPTLLNNLAWLYLDRGRLDDAARVYAQLAAGDDPTLACVAQAKLLQIHAQQSRAEDASASAQALLAMLPRTDHPQGHAIAVLALLDHGPPALHAQALRYLPKVPVEVDLQARLDSALARRGLAGAAAGPAAQS